MAGKGLGLMNSVADWYNSAMSSKPAKSAKQAEDAEIDKAAGAVTDPAPSGAKKTVGSIIGYPGTSKGAKK